MDGEKVSAEAQRLRESKALGRSSQLLDLFDFLVERSLQNAPPKEVEIALAVFGRSTVDAPEDSSVRVYVYRLRKKLQEFYASEPGVAGRLVIPKGEYRIVYASEVETAVLEEVTRQRPVLRHRRFWLLAIAGAVLINGLVWAGFWSFSQSRQPGIQARGQAPWSTMLRNGRQTILVVGDYYIFDEIDPDTGADRLVREYSINSARDLGRHLMRNPEKVGRYKDLGLSYLPVGTALALRDVIPVIAPAQGMRDRLKVVVASDLTADMLKQYNIVYVGYLSGLGLLRDPVMAGSRFEFGDTYDELIDQVTHQAYVSQEGGPEIGAGKQEDFGYFSSFAGPSGNRIIIVAGTRDTALMQTAEFATSRIELVPLVASVKRATAFEALYGVESIRRMNLGGRRIVAAPLKAEAIWGLQRDEAPALPAE